MARFNLQLFALPDELINHVGNWQREYGLTAVAMQFFPAYKAIRSSADVRADAAQLVKVHRIALGYGDPDMTAKTPYEFMVRNPDWLAVDIGDLSADGIRESVVGARTDEPRALKAWRAIVKKLKSETKSGLWGFNPSTTDRHFYKAWRYTNAAGERARQGLKLLPVGGVVVFRIDEPAADKH